MSDDDYSELEFDYRFAQINALLIPIPLIINIFHLSILIRKELRSLSVFILMISVCMCDITYLISNFLNFANEIRVYQRTDYCYHYDSLLMTYFQIYNTSFVLSTEFSSVWLVVLMALYRSLSVTFPLNQFIKKLTSPRITVIAVVLVVIPCFSFTSFPFLFIYSIQKWTKKYCLFIENVNYTEPDQYRLVYYEEQIPLLDKFVDAEYYMQFFQLGFYLCFAIILIISLKKTGEKRKNMSNQKTDKKDNTTKLVLAMTIVFFCTRVFHPMLTFVLSFFPDDSQDDIDKLMNIYYAIKSSLQSFHAASHCPLSFFMSTAYKDTVKRVFGVRKKMKVVSVTGSLTSKSSTTKI